ncbi:hypothetical protein DL546_006329 [Coniochaeta pulveracea]|uniref:Uncharacterized protein n=1 Tax=Coniochaeta pulveracea TaxID=177199 RepID=A0A420YKF1_9PEZI|nr:hypothetical protein DL546_006329 [Coniochaeta pulveracea]
MDINIVDPCDNDKLGGITGPACKTSAKVSFRLKEDNLNKAAIAEQCTDNNFAVDVSHLYQDAPPASSSGGGTASAIAPASSSTQSLRIKTEVVTVPLTTLTVYASSTETVHTSVTVTDTISPSAVTSQSTTAIATTSVTLPTAKASGPPSVSPFLPSTTPRARKARRNAGKWTFGQD